MLLKGSLHTQIDKRILIFAISFWCEKIQSDIRFFLFYEGPEEWSSSHPCWGSPTAKLTGKLFRPRDLLRRKWQTLTKADFQKFASWRTLFPGKNPWILMILIGLLEAFSYRRDSYGFMEFNIYCKHVLSGLKGMWPDSMVTFWGIFGPGPHLFRRLSWRLLAAVASRRSSSMCTWGRRDLSPLEISVTWQVFFRKPLDTLYHFVGKELGFLRLVGWIWVDNLWVVL